MHRPRCVHDCLQSVSAGKIYEIDIRMNALPSKIEPNQSAYSTVTSLTARVSSEQVQVAKAI